MNALLEQAGVWLPGTVAMLALTAASAFFSGCETAMFSLTREDLRRMGTGRPRERLAAALMRTPDRFLSAVLFWNLLVNLSFFTVSLITAKRLIAAGFPGAAAALSGGGLLWLILLGEVAPKSLAVMFHRSLAGWCGVPMTVATRLLDPILPALATVTAALRRMFWPHLKLEPYLDVEDIERAVETSELGVELVRLEQQILGRLLELSDMTAEEIMRPRGAYHVWKPPISREMIRSRGPIPLVLLIAGDDGDTVARAIPLYDLNHLPEDHLERIAEQVVYVPWCATVADVLARLRSQLVSVAGVVNEYGETVGVVLEDDILDTLLNPHSSRGRRLLERDPVVSLPDGTLLADGLTTLRYLAGRLDVDFETTDDSPVTLAALLQEELERFPQAGDAIAWHGWELRVRTAGEPGDPIQAVASRLPQRPSPTEE